jgi:hypothetical protein
VTLAISLIIFIQAMADDPVWLFGATSLITMNYLFLMNQKYTFLRFVNDGIVP